jgi:hypothetical protein
VEGKGLGESKGVSQLSQGCRVVFCVVVRWNERARNVRLPRTVKVLRILSTCSGSDAENAAIFGALEMCDIKR